MSPATCTKPIFCTGSHSSIILVFLREEFYVTSTDRLIYTIPNNFHFFILRKPRNYLAIFLNFHVNSLLQSLILKFRRILRANSIKIIFHLHHSLKRLIASERSVQDSKVGKSSLSIYVSFGSIEKRHICSM